MKLASLFPPLGWLSAVVAAAFAGFWLQVGPVVDQESSPALPASTEADAATGTGLALPPSSDLSRARALFAKRPLFAEGRRPFAPAPAAAEPAAPSPEPEPSPETPPKPPALVMLGTMLIKDEPRVLLGDPANGQEIWYGVGEMVSGWAIVEILPERTVLQLEGVEITFNLFQ